RVTLSESTVSILHSPQHVVERLDHQADLVIARLGCAQRVVASIDDPSSNVGYGIQWCHERTLQRRRGHKGDSEAQYRDQADNAGIVAQATGFLVGRSEVERADPLILREDLASQLHATVDDSQAR